MSWMQTYKGHKLDFINPDPKEIDIEDIAHALSNICRFSGHCAKFYSVAQHSVYVAQLSHPDHRLAGLMHDATEAYIGDMVSPLKRLIPDFSAYENRLWALIAGKYGLPGELPEDVKAADLDILAMEARDLLGADPVTWGLKTPTEKARIHPWSPHVAKIRFMEAFETYTGEYATGMLRAYASP